MLISVLYFMQVDLRENIRVVRCFAVRVVALNVLSVGYGAIFLQSNEDEVRCAWA